MKYLDFYNKLNIMNEEEYIENYLIYNTAVIIAGAKPAVTIAIKRSNLKLYTTWHNFGKSFIENIGLEFVELRKSNESTIVMIYDKDVLCKEITKKKHVDFLTKLGYSQSRKISDYVDKLKSRYEKYHCPHELGLFLGIPIEDVKDFMDCTTKKCLMCGY